MKIRALSAFQIYDSRGRPTLEAEVELEDGTVGRGLVPAGASTGRFEALELRDGDPARWGGRSVLRAVENLEREIAPAVAGRDAADQAGLDRLLAELDGTPNKGRLGANAILGVSLAAADASARAAGQPLYEYLGRGAGRLLPLPEIQIIGGGAHAGGRLDLQDFMLIAVGARSFPEALAITHDVYHAAGALLQERGILRGVADEGGYWPEFKTNEEAIATVVEAIERAGYAPGRDAAIALDVAASEFYEEADRRYHLRREGLSLAAEEFVRLLASWCDRYPIVSIEDPMAETDGEGWKLASQALGRRIQLVGDDLFVTQAPRIRQGVAQGLANAVLIKPNQVGTLTETLEAIRLTQEAGWRPVISARSGETEDAFIAHLAVATNAGQLKVGSFARSERMAKWNEVLRIGRRLGATARFRAGPLVP